jgi:hypothetical protein
MELAYFEINTRDKISLLFSRKGFNQLSRVRFHQRRRYQSEFQKSVTLYKHINFFVQDLQRACGSCSPIQQVSGFDTQA